MASWSQKDKEAFAKGARGEATPVAPPATDRIPAQDGETPEEADIGNQQAANLANPSAQDKLNKVAAARAKFFGDK